MNLKRFKLLISILILMLLVTSAVTIPTYLRNKPADIDRTSAKQLVESAEFVPGEVLIKLRNEQSPHFKIRKEKAQVVSAQTDKFEVSDLDPDLVPGWLTNINNKYKVKGIEKVIKDHSTTRRFLDEFKKKNNKKIGEGKRKIDENTILENDIASIYKLDFDANVNLKAVINDLKQDREILVAEPNFKIQLHHTPNDTLYPRQWGLNNTLGFDADIDAPQAWDITKGSPDVIIAVVDSGIDYTHPDLGGCIGFGCKVIYGRAFVGTDPDPMDVIGHGTIVAGIAAGLQDNSLGISGVCPECSLMALKIIGDDGSGELDTALIGITYAIDNGADIVNNSWGSFESSALLEDVIDTGTAAGVAFVASAGNVGYFGLAIEIYPAAFQNVLAVGATSNVDLYTYYSNYGVYVDVSAPGGELLQYSLCVNEGILAPSTYGLIWDASEAGCRIVENGHVYIATEGTSMAAPHASGVAGLLLSQNPQLSPQELFTIMKDYSEDIDPFNPTVLHGLMGDGRINAYYALTKIDPPPAPSITPRPTEFECVPDGQCLDYGVCCSGTYKTDLDNCIVSTKICVPATAPTNTPIPTPGNSSCTATEGDANGDGVANGNDFTAWLRNFSETPLTNGPDTSKGDFNCDGYVNGNDFTRWLRNFTP